MSRRSTNPSHIAEILILSKEYSIVKHAAGTWLIDDWLFIWPKNCKWGHRYEFAYGHYAFGKLAEFVKQATEKYKLSGQYKGQKVGNR